jgi:EAL domain-containing protein (putative c-di-GMP-specific phosphodiesterase class I)/AmiR/NasT family two-component response regulator
LGIDFYLTRGEIVPMAGVPVRVLVADDQDLTGVGPAAACASAGEFELVGVAANAAEAAKLAAEKQPDVAVVAVRLEGGADVALDEILTASPDTRVLAHAGALDHELVIALLHAGASGYVARGAPPEKLAAAVQGAVRGSSALDDVVGHGLIHELLDQVRETNLAREARARKRARIRSAMESGALDIVFQPIVHLDSRAVVGHEALSRFAERPIRGPQEWFEEAHAVGLGKELELHAVCVACERSRLLPPGTFMAVNVSPDTAEDPELLPLLDCAHVDHIVIEVTEHAPVNDYPRFRSALARMRELGTRLAIDDAGAGFASLRHILELNAELIKLDGSLTHSLEADPRRRSLASALIEFGRESGASVLAEHIESEMQLCELRRLGVTYGQGFHLGRPQALPRLAA